MNFSNFIGWDIGGAHLKVASVTPSGEVNFVEQFATPLWEGIDKLKNILPDVLKALPSGASAHAITMTAELVDIFEDRQAGIKTLINLCEYNIGAQINLYAAEQGFLFPNVAKLQSSQIASANWHASARYAASCIDSGLFVDVGSTTTDIIPFHDNQLDNQGVDDQSRMKFDELVYTGVIRSSLMSLTQRVPFAGEWQGLAAEHFATTADVYRILGLLDDNDDLMDSADGRAKDLTCSMIRLARMIGADASATTSRDSWYQLAKYFSEVQIQIITNAILRVMSRYKKENITIIGAGAGRFLTKKIAERIGYPYLEFSELFDCNKELQHKCNVCAPAVALAQLHRLNGI